MLRARKAKGKEKGQGGKGGEVRGKEREGGGSLGTFLELTVGFGVKIFWKKIRNFL